MKKQGLALSAFISTLGSVITKALGIVSTIYISNAIGPEGVGLYHLTTTVYMMAYMIASAGMSTSVSKMVAEEIGHNNGKGIKKIMNVFFAISIIASILITSGIFTFADVIGAKVVNDSRTVLGLRVLSLSIPFMTVSCCIKGYFYAVKKMIKPVSSDVMEQIVKVILVIVFLRTWGGGDLIYACAAIGLGITLGEVFSFSYMLILYLTDPDRRARREHKDIGTTNVLTNIIKLLLPITLTAYISSMITLLQNILIPVGFRKSGLTAMESMSMYGMIQGMVFPILFFPVALLTACSTVLTPEIARAQARNIRGRVESLSGRTIHLIMVLAMIVVSIFLNFGREFGVLIYHNSQVGQLLQLLVIVTPFMYIEIVIDGILKGLGEQNSCLIYRIIESVLSIGLIYFLIPIKGVEGFIVLNIGISILTATLKVRRLIAVTDIKIQLIKWFVHPALAATAAGMTAKVIVLYLLPQTAALGLQITLGIGITLCIYYIALTLLENVTKEDLAVLDIRGKNC
ncbi:oligosaccharide flippase family protein [Niameybacter massiliensis]|uniref:Oligosaccharide flippase family protein n=1 Tax=Holtiella tumoricola TaxID=3018743 RepID=A0AA42DR18_9FIRM|nr:oligosaccharide flippase family protein [Holtiella tumoricola]MDA3733303.1 oligosaccharide flippase family protein [Holtiella tumoricola]